MIFEAVFRLMLETMSVLLSPLPVADELGFGPVAPVFEAMGRLNSALPIAEALAAFSIFLAVVGGVFAYRIIVAIRGFLPFV